MSDRLNRNMKKMVPAVRVVCSSTTALPFRANGGTVFGIVSVTRTFAAFLLQNMVGRGDVKLDEALVGDQIFRLSRKAAPPNQVVSSDRVCLSCQRRRIVTQERAC
jgi:hypothetical protein